MKKKMFTNQVDADLLKNFKRYNSASKFSLRPLDNSLAL